MDFSKKDQFSVCSEKNTGVSEIVLEPISFTELAEVLGGNGPKSQGGTLKPDSGHAGGLLCWC